MATKTTLIVLGLLLALAGLVTYVALGDGSRREAASREAPAAPLEQAAGPTALEAASSVAPVAGPKEAPLGERAAVAPVAEAPAARPADAPTAAATGLAGRVVDPQGRPVAGADVVLEPSFAPMVFRDGAPSRPEARTDADGGFELTLASPTGGTLKVGADGFAPFERDVPAPVPGVVTELEPLVLALGAEVSGRVVDSSGRPVEGVAVHLGRAEGDMPRFSVGALFGLDAPLATTAADGAFHVRRLPLGPFRLDFTSQRHPTRAVEGQTDDVAPRMVGLVVELADGAAIEGRVLGLPAGREGVSVIASRAGGAGPTMVFGPAGAERRAPVAADGSFRVEGLVQGGDYRLRVTASPRPDSPQAAMRAFGRGMGGQGVNAKAGARNVELEWSEPASLSFRALESGTMVPVERYRATFEGGGTMGFARFAAEAESELWVDGRCVLSDLAVREGRPGTLRIVADGYEPFERTGVELQPGQALDLGDVLLRSAPSIEVAVRDGRDGTPVVGATVRLELAPEPVAPGERRVGFRAAATRGGRTMGGASESRSARTDERGIAVVAAPGAGVGMLTVESTAHAPLVLADVQMPTEGRVRRDLSLTMGGSVRVEVFDADGAPLAGARVEHRAPRERGAMDFFSNSDPLVSDRDGIVAVERLEPGVHRFRLDASPAATGNFTFRVEGARDTGPPWSEVTVVEDGRADLRLVAERMGSLEGRVREAGKPLAGADVDLMPASADDPFRLAGMRGFFGGGGAVQTDGEGRYRLGDLRPGSYVLRITHGRRAMAEEIPIEIAAQAQRRDVDLPVTAIEGRITDGAGKPVAGLRVRAQRPAPEGAARGMRAMMVMTTDDGEESGVMQVGDASSGGVARTDEDGRYRLHGLPADTEIQVVASGPEVREVTSAVLRLLPDEVRTGIDLVAEAAGNVRVRVTGADGQPRGILILNAEPADGREVEAPTGFVGPDGVGTLRGLAPGAWRVWVVPMGPSPEPAAERRVEVEAGETAEITLEVAD